MTPTDAQRDAGIGRHFGGGSADADGVRRDEDRSDTLLPDRSRRSDARRNQWEKPVRHVQHRSRDPVSELELLELRTDRRAEVGERFIPGGLGAGGRRLREVTEHGHRPARAPPGDGSQFHVREVLSFVHHDVAVHARNALDQRVGLVDQHELGGGPRLVVELASAGSDHQALLVSVEHSVGGAGQRGATGQQALHQSRAADRRPDPPERGLEVGAVPEGQIERRRLSRISAPAVDELAAGHALQLGPKSLARRWRTEPVAA